MAITQAMIDRHSVRQYLDKEIPEGIRAELDAYVEAINVESGMHIQVIYDEPECFSSRMAHYGNFKNANNYIAVVGKKGADLDENAGYYGEKVVLKAQELGLNTCWAALTHGKTKAIIAKDEKEAIVISLGFGATQGVPHQGKTAPQVSDINVDAPEWYRQGIEAALMAPTAINQQKFFFTRDGNQVSAKTKGLGTCLKIDLGIVKCHFEIGAETENFEWK